MKRTIFAEIEVEEELAFEKIDDGPIAYLEQEFGWLEQSGITLINAKISDTDDEDLHERYINYVLNWAMNASDDSLDGKKSPDSYEKWLSCAAKIPERKYSGKKIALVEPTAAAVALIADIGSGARTQNNDRTSRYLTIAIYEESQKDQVHVCIVENKNGLPESEWGYSVHVVDDQSPFCQIYDADSLSVREVATILECVLSGINENEESEQK